MSRVLFIGGPGNISTSAVELILERNHEVGIFTLPESPDKGMDKKVKFYRGDRNNAEEIKAALDDFKPEHAKQYLHDIASDAPVFELSSKDQSGMQLWLDWLFDQIEKHKAHVAAHPVAGGHQHHHHEHEHEHQHAHAHAHAEGKTP